MYESDNEKIEIIGYITLRKSGNIDKIPDNDSLFGKSFFVCNMQSIQKSYDNNISIVTDIFKQMPGYARIFNNLKPSKEYELVFPKDLFDKVRNGELEFLKSSTNKNEFLPLLRESGKRQIVKQLRVIETDFNLIQIDNLLSTVQMLGIQQSLINISNKLEKLDAKLDSMLIGAQHDRLAYIQSAYNLYLQTRVNEKFKESLYPQILGQLNLGREQLIYSLKYLLNNTLVKKTKFSAFSSGLFKGENIEFENKNRYFEIKQTLRFIIRSTQLLSVIYHDMNEKWSMLQSVITLKEVLGIFDQEAKDLLVEWSGEDKIAEILFENISEIYNTIDRQVNTDYCKPKLNLKIRT